MINHHLIEDLDELHQGMQSHSESQNHSDNHKPALNVERMEEGFEQSLAPHHPAHLNDFSSEASTLTSEQGYSLEWKKISMTVDSPKPKVQGRRILNNAWGRCPSGKVTAIMGPSGSGKTSLLNVLSGRMSNKSTNGVTIETKNHILWNGYLVDPASIYFRKTIAFVAQDDTLLDTGAL